MFIVVHKDSNNNPSWFGMTKGDFTNWQSLAQENNIHKMYFIQNTQEQQAANNVFYKTHKFDNGILKNENDEQIATAQEIEFVKNENQEITGVRYKV